MHCLAALRWLGYRPANRYIVFQVLPHTLGLGPEVTRELAGNGVGNGTDKSGGWIETDGATGRSVLKLPLPEPQVLQQLTVALSRLVAGVGR